MTDCMTALPTGRDDNLTRFRQMLAGQPELQERLGQIELPDDFIAAAIAAAADFAIVLDRDTLSGSLRIGPIDTAGFLPAEQVSGEWPPLGWLPARSAATGGTPAFDWFWFGRTPLTEPFHRDTVRRFGFRPMGLMTRVRTDLATLIAGAKHEPTLEPSGLIFHMSRCGSTLAAQMLAAVPDHIVMSEAEPVDAVVQWASISGAPHDEQVAALRAVVAALGRNRNGTSRRYFLKLDAWHGFALPLFRAAFPDTPWLFLYRDPAEVLVSLRMEPGIQSAPGGLSATLIGFDPDQAMSLEDYAARLFANLFDRILTAASDDAAGGRAMLIHYPDLVRAMEHAIPAHFGFVPTRDEAEAMASAAMRDAKYPEHAFMPDSSAKRAQVSVEMTRAIGAWLTERYAALQAKTSET